MDARARTPGWPAGLLQVTLLVVDGVRFRRDMAMMVMVMTMVVMNMVMITTDVRFMRDMARGL